MYMYTICILCPIAFVIEYKQALRIGEAVLSSTRVRYEDLFHAELSQTALSPYE